MLPEILNSKDGGISVLNRMGVNRSFMDDMYRKYGSLASKIPGLNKNIVGNTLGAIEKAMGSKPNPVQPSKKSSGFDASRYPKL